MNVAIGVLIVVHCLFLLVSERWFMEKSAKGRWLVRKFGTVAAPWVFRGLVGFSMGVGVLLAIDVIRPVRW